MAKKPLNAEEIAELRSSPYVASVIGNKISFTPEFKRMAYEQITSGCKLPSQTNSRVIIPGQ